MLKVILKISIYLILFSVTMPSQASMRTDELYWDCKDNIKILICVGYISGVTDAITMMSDLQKITLKTKPILCLPSRGISNDQSMKIVLKYIELNPEIMHQSARSSIFIALSKAFKCKY